MEITQVPFARTIGLNKSESGGLELCFDKSLHNHVQTVAASAQYSLAELASADHLQKLFPDLVNKAVPLLRDSRLKFKKPAQSRLAAFPAVSGNAVAKFAEQFNNKGRALITIDVAVRDVEGAVTSSGSFVWYVKKL